MEMYPSNRGLILFLSELDTHCWETRNKIIWNHSSSGDDNIKSKFVFVVIPQKKWYFLEFIIKKPFISSPYCVVDQTFKYTTTMFASYRNYKLNFQIYDLVTIILLRVKLNKMLNMTATFDTFKILGKEGCDYEKILTSSYPLIKFMLFISIHKIEGCC